MTYTCTHILVFLRNLSRELGTTQLCRGAHFPECVGYQVPHRPTCTLSLGSRWSTCTVATHVHVCIYSMYTHVHVHVCTHMEAHVHVHVHAGLLVQVYDDIMIYASQVSRKGFTWALCLIQACWSLAKPWHFPKLNHLWWEILLLFSSSTAPTQINNDLKLQHLPYHTWGV